MSNLSQLETPGFSFGIHEENDWLLRAFNAALSAIPHEIKRATLRRWSGGMMLADKKLMLTQAEQQWIKDHPVVKVSTAGSLVPVAFFDKDDTFVGISADVLNLVSQRTGLKFEIAHLPTSHSAIDEVLKGSADLVDSVSATPEREKFLSFTRPYMAVTNVVVTRNTPDAPKGLGELNGKRLAVPLGHLHIEALRREHPLVILKLVSTPFNALKDVLNEQADAALTPSINADYHVNRVFSNQLRINSSSDFPETGLSYATRRENAVLHSIMEKAIFSIPPDEIAVLVNQRWRTNIEPENQTKNDYSTIAYRVIAAAFLLLVAIAWSSYQRREINRRKRAEWELGNQLQFMEALINGTPHPIYVRDRDGIMVLCNDYYLEELSLTREEVLNKPIIPGAYSLSEHVGELQKDYNKVIATGMPILKDRSMLWGGATVTVYHWIQPYRDTQGNILGVICGWIDISERRRLLEELQAAKNVADDASLAKTKFLATMSHEIRTPMNAVIGMLELALKQSEQGQMDRPAIETAYHSARGMLELIGDILDIVRIESGKLSLDPERANLHELIESIGRVFDGLARQKSLSLNVKIDPGLNRDVLIDPLRFKQILSNLVGNAIKFTERGNVLIKAHVTSAVEGKLQVSILVQDSGIGISDEDQEIIFHALEQARTPLKNVHRGTGLGLSICHALCEMMGSRLELRSALGVGTSIQFTLLLDTLEALTPSLAQDKLQTSPPQPLHVLVVDDHPANRKLLCQQITLLGHTTESTEDGKKGLEAWVNEHYDLIITDSNMPVMDGYALTEAVREWEAQHDAHPCTIIGLTANAQREELERCLAVGMNDCLFKPLDLATLSEKLMALRPHAGKMNDREPDSEFDFRALKKLTGGDSSLIEDLLGEMIESNDSDLQALAQALDQNEVGTVANVTKNLRETAFLIKAERVLASSQAVIQVCENPQSDDLSLVSEQAARLQNDTERLQTALKAIFKASTSTWRNHAVQ